MIKTAQEGGKSKSKESDPVSNDATLDDGFLTENFGFCCCFFTAVKVLFYIVHNYNCKLAYMWEKLQMLEPNSIRRDEEKR